MKRRALIIRAITGSVSAGVFTATGWLMGTRSLTMAGDGTWTSWYVDTTCSEYGTTCGCRDEILPHCEVANNCTPPNCYEWDLEQVHCCDLNGVACKWRTRSLQCGSCVTC
jgi:hypothetical protein